MIFLALVLVLVLLPTLANIAQFAVFIDQGLRRGNLIGIGPAISQWLQDVLVGVLAGLSDSSGRRLIALQFRECVLVFGLLGGKNLLLEADQDPSTFFLNATRHVTLLTLLQPAS